jgi:SAM-dependent methyltransferase
MSKLRSILNREMFYPRLIGILTNPFFHARLGLEKGIRSSAHYLSGSLLDVGCGAKPYQQLFRYSDYIGLDTDNSGHDHKNENVDVYYDGKTFPFENDTFNSVLCNQVLEHVFEPDLLLSEVHRVLKDKGTCLFTVPFIWDEHEQPFDYARYSSFGLKYIFEKNGFEILFQAKLVNDLRVVAQLLNAYIYKLSRSIPIVKQLTMVLVMFPINVFGILLSVFPSNPDLYLDNLIVARKK